MRLLILLSILMSPLVAHGQDIFSVSAVKKDIASAQKVIEKIEVDLSGNELNPNDVLKSRPKLRETINDLQENIDTVEPVFEALQKDIEDLGVAPKEVEGEEFVDEPDNIKARREELTEEISVADGLIQEAEALVSKSSRLLEKIASIRRGQFINKIFEKQTSMFNGDLWVNASNAYAKQSKYLSLSALNDTPVGKFGIGLSVLAFIVLFAAATIISRKTLIAKHTTDKRAFSLAAASSFTPVIAAAIGLTAIYQTLISLGYNTDGSEILIGKILLLILFLIAIIIVASRMAYANVIRPSVKWLSICLAVIFVIDSGFLNIGKYTGAPLEITVAQSYIVTSIFALILGLFSFIIARGCKKSVYYFFPKKFFVLLAFVAVFIMTANIFGYAALSRFIFERMVLLFSLITATLALRVVIRPYFLKIDALFTSDDKTPADKNKDKDNENLIFFWLTLCLDVIILIVCLPLLANMAGMEWHNIQEFAVKIFFGFKVGYITISIANICLAAGLFLFLFFATRLLQSFIAKKVFPKTKMHVSIQQSIVQVLGYVGLIIALLAAVSAIGFKLSNLALIAGALSVGIGFGLQSIVSNFVSGLILLFERPIKANDWIITNSGEGIVKKINVRATEIETFDHTSIIVPNSELISSSVKNWTHKNNAGRATITVGVSYNSNPHDVMDILLRCVTKSKHSLTKPAPTIYFKEFADSALVFDVRFFIKHIRDVHKVSTAVRLEIWDALKDNGIEISYPQRDIHIRTTAGLENIVKKPKK